MKEVTECKRFKTGSPLFCMFGIVQENKIKQDKIAQIKISTVNIAYKEEEGCISNNQSTRQVT